MIHEPRTRAFQLLIKIRSAFDGVSKQSIKLYSLFIQCSYFVRRICTFFQENPPRIIYSCKQVKKLLMRIFIATETVGVQCITCYPLAIHKLKKSGCPYVCDYGHLSNLRLSVINSYVKSTTILSS